MAARMTMGEAHRLSPAQQQLFDQGVEHFKTGRWAQGEAVYRQLVAQCPDFPDAHYNLGISLKKQRKLNEAVACYRRTLALRPAFPDCWINLGNVFHETHQPDLAIEAFRQALAVNPEAALAWTNLAVTFKDTGQLNAALSCCERGLELLPDDAINHGSRLYTLVFHPDFDAAAIYRESRRWNERFASRLAKEGRPHENDPTPGRRLRVGYVSPDFRQHCVAMFISPLLAHHHHDEVEIYCYSNVANPDVVTARLQRCADVWRDISRLSDQAAAELIRQDKIDILVDLALHMAGGRLLLFARKPAPIQVTWLGYVGTTGMDTIDYRFTDPRLDPLDMGDAQIRNPKSEIRINDQNPNDQISNRVVEQPKTLSNLDIGKLGFDSDFGFRISDFATQEPYYSERSVRLPDSFWCYDPHGIDGGEPAAVPEPAPLPALAAGYVTFGCLNNFCKVTPATLALWSGVLAAIPNSHLLLYCPPGSHRGRVIQKLGVASERVQFVTFQPWQPYLRTYGQIDICLDPIPCNGGTTSLDAIWMGVPLVTLVGATAVGRAGWSILHNVGMTELAARDHKEFVEIAARLAGDLSRLSQLRGELRGRLERSPLMDGPRFAGHIEAAYRQMWRGWCAKRGGG